MKNTAVVEGNYSGFAGHVGSRAAPTKKDRSRHRAEHGLRVGDCRGAERGPAP